MRTEHLSSRAGLMFGVYAAFVFYIALAQMNCTDPL
jgi:hypothetical protein